MDKIKRWAKENIESVVQDLQDFARIPSVSRADLAVPGSPFGPDVKRMLDTPGLGRRDTGFSQRITRAIAPARTWATAKKPWASSDIWTWCP
jgi:hypothetical protein